MDRANEIVLAAEKPSIAGLLARHVRQPVAEREVVVHRDPAETGSFLISWRQARYRLSPAGRVVALGMPRRRPVAC